MDELFTLKRKVEIMDQRYDALIIDLRARIEKIENILGTDSTASGTIDQRIGDIWKEILR